MTINSNTKEYAIILCGHGSRNPNYTKDFLSLKSKIKKKFKDTDVLDCFIEINNPTVDLCINENIKKYKRFFFFPLLLFEGKHLQKDIQNKLKIISEKRKVEIILLDKISLIHDILFLIPGVIQSLNKKDYDLLITSCSYSKSNRVIKELENYTKKLSDLLKIKNQIFHFAGDEKEVLKKIDYVETNILLHPIFLFDGFLYNRNIERFSIYKNLSILSPLSQYNSVSSLISRKLINSVCSLY